MLLQQGINLLLLLVGVFLTTPSVLAKKYYDSPHGQEWKSPHDKYKKPYENYQQQKYYDYDYDYDRGNAIPRRDVKPDWTTMPPLPPATEAAKMARFVIHNVDWVSVATISTSPGIQGYPFNNVFSMSDGPVSNGSGIPYFYMTPLDLSSKDLGVESRTSVVASLAESTYCKEKKYDPEDPRCARVILTGKMKKIKLDKPEIDFARNALFSRHPEMTSWPADHGFYVAKLKIHHIVVLDYFGGAKFVGVQEYLTLPPETQQTRKL